MTPLGWLGIIFVATGFAITAIFKKYYMPPIEPDPVPTPTPTPPNPPPMPPQPAPKTPEQKIYEVAYANLGKHLTLDNSVPEEVGCVEAVSAVLAKAGYQMPPKGIMGVNALIAWMEAKGFTEIEAHEVGAIITAHSPNFYTADNAHTGICGEHWIMSNSSTTGLFTANYTFPGWVAYFSTRNSHTRYFRPV